MSRPTFSQWLSSELEQRQVSRRELARRLAAQRPEDGDRFAEAQRRNLRRILSGQKATQSTRDAICDALGIPRDAAPSLDEEAEDEEADLLLPLMREIADLRAKLEERDLEAARR